jgi:hypothetical protein
MYFNVKTIEEAKNEFRDLCKMLHPDTSGYNSQSDFIKMFNEFKAFKPSVTTKAEDETVFDADEFYNLLKHFDVLNNIKINFVGTFIWLEDLEPKATYNQREQIKGIVLEGFNSVRFAPVRKLWYFSPEDYKQRKSSKKSFEEIKECWGTTSFKMNNTLTLN